MMLHSTKEHGTNGGARHYHLAMEAEHECLICNKTVLQDSATLRNHFHTNHGINLATYEIKYYFPSLGYEVPKRLKCYNPISKLNCITQKPTEFSAKDKYAWRNGCMFACNFCPKKMSSKDAMRHHSKQEHGKGRGAGNYRLTTVAEHKCLLCNRNVVQDSTPLRDHMSKNHQINLETYEQEYYFPSLGYDYEVPKILSSNNPMSKLNCKTQKPTEFNHQDKYAWRNSCMFACNLCPKEMSDKRTMRQHSAIEHDTDGGARHYRLSVLAEHECLICKRNVVQDSGPLRDHMSKKHRMNLATYEEKYYFPGLGH